MSETTFLIYVIIFCGLATAGIWYVDWRMERRFRQRMDRVIDFADNLENLFVSTPYIRREK